MAKFKAGRQAIFVAVVIGAVYGLYVYASTTSQSQVRSDDKPAVVIEVDKAAATDTETDPQEAADAPAAAASGIVLSDNGNGRVSWVAEGASELGYKVVWSLTQGPSYPTRPSDRYQYFSDPSVNTATVEAFDGDGTYYVRVCEYLGGECGMYSNEISVNLVSQKAETKPAEETDTSESGVASISLTGSGKSVAWSVDGYSGLGFKVVWSKTAAPTYPTRDGDRYQYFSDPSARSATLDAFDGAGEYHVRVCEYLGGKCGVYSDEISLTLDDGQEEVTEEASGVTSIALWGEGAAVAWNVEGHSDMGFKVVWSQTPGPTYPTRDSDRYLYLSDPAANAASLDAFDGEGGYFVRVCEYLGGSCGVYSNEIQIDL